MSDDANALAVTMFSEILTLDQLLRNRLSRILPKGMEISHFSVLNHLGRFGQERTPASLAKSFHVTRGAMTNTLSKLEMSGYVHVRPDWDDARSKLVSISPAGVQARDQALAAITPMMDQLASEMGGGKLRQVLPVLRELRQRLEQAD